MSDFAETEMVTDVGRKPKGWYSKQARAERAAAAQAERERRAAGRDDVDRTAAMIDRQMAPVRAAARRQREQLPPHTRTAPTVQELAQRRATEAARVQRLHDRDRKDRRADRKRAAAEVEIERGRYVNIGDTFIRPTPEQQAKGDYHEVVIEKGKGHVRDVKAMKNRGGTAVERWFARGDLDRGQAEAITLFARAWRLRYECGGWAAMNWGLVNGARGGAVAFEQLVANQLAAKDLLEHLDTAVFFAFPLHYFEVWKRVVIEDEAAGVAGSRLGFSSKQAEAAAKSIVRFIADMIATDLRLGNHER